MKKRRNQEEERIIEGFSAKEEIQDDQKKDDEKVQALEQEPCKKKFLADKTKTLLDFFMNGENINGEEMPSVMSVIAMGSFLTFWVFLPLLSFFIVQSYFPSIHSFYVLFVHVSLFFFSYLIGFLAYKYDANIR